MHYQKAPNKRADATNLHRFFEVTSGFSTATVYKKHYIRLPMKMQFDGLTLDVWQNECTL